MVAVGQLEPWEFKGLPLGHPVAFDELGRTGWNVAAGDTATPVAVLRADALRVNAETMRRFCTGHGVELAPHAKTTLSPELVALQTKYGAWAMTAALSRQVAALWAAGVPRVLMANELTDPAAARWLVAELDRDPAKALWCYVDSVAGVNLLESALQDRHDRGGRPLSVLVEVGHDDGRTGCRSRAVALEVAAAASAATGLRLAGVAGYEGTLGVSRDAATLARVDAFVAELAGLADALAQRRLLDVTEPPLVTAGGSIFFDRVAVGLAQWSRRSGGTVVLRSGCYLIHDHGLYAAATPARDAGWELPSFAPALEVWSRVVSRPEPGLALLDAGRRDLSFDAGLPVALRWSRLASGGEIRGFAGSTTVDALSDQHTFLRLLASEELAVGDLVALGISHPCTTLDRWRVLLLVDDSYAVTGGVHTTF